MPSTPPEHGGRQPNTDASGKRTNDTRWKPYEFLRRDFAFGDPDAPLDARAVGIPSRFLRSGEMEAYGWAFAAAWQHEMSPLFLRRIRRIYGTQKAFAQQCGIPEPRVSQILRGAVPMNARDITVFDIRLGPLDGPDADAARKRLTEIAESLEFRRLKAAAATTGQKVDGREAMMEALQTTGLVQDFEPPTDEQAELRTDLAAAAQAGLTVAVARLNDELRLGISDQDIGVQFTDASGVRGDYMQGFVLIVMGLDESTWPETVANDEVVLDGRFVMSVDTRDDRGRPLRVTALTPVPDELSDPDDPFGTFEAVAATVTWNGDAPELHTAA